MQTVQLKNGTTCSDILVTSTILSLRLLAEGGIFEYLQLYDLVSKCNNTAYEINTPNVEALKELGLLQSNGLLHDDIKNIVLSATRLDGVDIFVDSPVLGK